MAEIAISLPFSLDSYGKIAVTSDQKKIWADRVRSVIGTSLRERVMRPRFGTIIPFALFETHSKAAQEVQIEVEKSFSGQLPLLELEETNVTIDEVTNTMKIEIVYGLPNGEVQNTVVGLVYINSTKPLFEELL